MRLILKEKKVRPVRCGHQKPKSKIAKAAKASSQRSLVVDEFDSYVLCLCSQRTARRTRTLYVQYILGTANDLWFMHGA